MSLVAIGFVVGLCIIPSLLGWLDIFYFIKKPPLPVDQSNVINRITLYWFTKKHPDDFVEMYPWLMGDMGENLDKEKK